MTSLVWIFIVFPFVQGNNIPVFEGLITTDVSHDEGTATPGGTTLHTFTVNDADGQNPIMSYTYNPTDGTDMFDITEANPTAGTTTAVVKLKTTKQFDYETHSLYKVNALATDGIANASAYWVLNINVNDVGEWPSLSPTGTTEQAFTIDESPAGTAVGSPSFTIVDVDTFETHNWTITGGTGQPFISINPANGSIILATNYDREVAGTASHVYVDVKITDKWGLSVTLTYSVTITDINDNLPIFTSATTFNFDVNQTAPTDVVIATLAATDADATSPNNEITYSLDTTTTADYFQINQTGSVIFLYTMDIEYGTGPYTFYAYATDGGSPAYTATATFTLSVPAVTTPPTTTTLVPPAEYSPSSDSSNVIMLIVACSIAAIILGYILILCWRWNTFGQCLPDTCPTTRECRASCDRCCACCPGDDIDADDLDERIVVVPSKKGAPLGPEAFNSSIKKPTY